MATLQDLFNEIQADSRISNPPTFEDFQSKMEDPAYAERVNEILGRNGYDVNAYEGLKKKEESMVESAPLSQQESEQPSEVTEPIQTVGTEPLTEISKESTPLQSDFSAYKIDVKPPKFLSGNTSIQTVQPSQEAEAISVEQNVTPIITTPESKHSSILGLAKKAKNKFTSKYINPIFSQVNEATAEFSEDVKATENGISEVGEGDPKKKEVKDAATSMYNEFDALNHRQALRILGDTQALGVKMDGDNYEVIFTNSKMGGKDQGRTYKGVVGDATWNGYVSNNMESTDLYTDENAWEDLKSAVITQDTYSPEIDGSTLQPNFNNNLASHKSKYFSQGKVGQITGTVTVPSEEKDDEKNVLFGTDLKRLAEKIKIKVKTSEIINKDREENKIYNIAQETIPQTEYVMDTEQSFYSSLNNTPETNAIMEANALNFSDVLLPSTKSKERVVAGINTFLEKAGYDPNEISQQSNVIYKEMLRDARYHAAEQYIRHEIESGNKTFKQQDIDRLFQAKQQRVDEIKGDDSLAIQSDQAFVSNLWDVSLSDYTNHYDAKATVRGRNMDIKNIPGKVGAFTQRMNELNAQIEAEKNNMQLPSEEQLGQSIQAIKDIKSKVDNYDAQLSQIENEINSLIVEQDGKQYLKDEGSRQKYEELTNQSNQILSERNALAEQSKESYKDVEKAEAFQKKVSRQVKEYNALVKKTNYYDNDPDLLAMKGLSNTLTSIEDYEVDKSAGVKNDLYDFEEYRQKKSEEEAAIKADAEDDTVIEASWKGVTGGLSNALIGTFKTGMYAADAISGDDNVWDSGDAAKAAVSQLQENISTWAFNPNYEKWGLNWFVNGAAGAIPDLAAVYLTGGGAGFAELAGTRGVVGALGKIAVSPTTVYFTVRSTGDYAERLQKAGYSPGEAFLGGGLIAGVEAGLESMLPEFFATSERIGIKSTFKEAIELGMSQGLSPKEIAKQLTLSYAKTSRNFGKQVFRKTSNESVEEGTQTGFSEVSFAVATDETIEIFNPQTGGMGKTLEAIAEASAIGGAIGNVGASMQGVRTIIRERSENTTLKLTQLQIGRKYNEIVKQADGLSNEFKGSEVEKEYKKIHEEYTKLASNPNFVKYDDAAKAEVLNMSLTLNELKEAQKNYSNQNIEDVKLNNEINQKEKELAATIGTAQKNADAREEMNKQLQEIGVQSFTLNANGDINGMTFDEFTTQEEEADIIKKATDIIEKVYKPKQKENAVQEPSTGEVLQRESQETGETGGQRKGVEPVLEGEGTTQEVGKEEIVATPQEAKEQEAMQNDIDQVQQSTGTVINLNEDGTLTINAPQRGGQSKKDAAIENAKQELANLGYNVESRVTQPQATTQKGGVKKVKAFRTEGTGMGELSVAYRGSGKYFALDVPFSTGKKGEVVTEQEIEIDPAKTIDLTKSQETGVADEASNLYKEIQDEAKVRYDAIPESERSMSTFNDLKRDIALEKGYTGVISYIEPGASPDEMKKIGREYVAYDSKSEESTPQFQKNKETVEDSTETIVDEMNKMGGVNIEVNVNEGLRDKSKLNIKSFFNRIGIMLKPKEVKLSDFAGKPIMVTISDELTTGEIINPITGEKIDNLKGGLGFNYSEGNEGHAWAYTNEKVAADVLNVAKQMYAANPSLYPDGIVPVAVVKMGKAAMISNEAVVRQVIQNLKTSKIPSKNKKEAFKILSQDIKAQIQVVKERIDKAQSQGKQANQADTNILKGYNDILDLISKSKSFDEVVNKITDLNIGVRPLLISRITSGSADLIPKDNALSADKPVAKALMNGLPKAEYKRIHLGHLVSNITEPALKEVPDKHIMAFVGIDARAEAPIKSDTHPNYPYVLKGKGLGMLSETVHIANAIPAAYGNIVGKLIAAEQKGGRVSQNEAVSRALPAALNNAIFRNKPISEIDENVSRLIGFLQLSFPNTQFFTDKESWKDIMNSEGVKKYLKKGDVVYGLTMDGKIYLNPDFSNFNTPIHETGHLWVDMIEESSPELFQKGLELVEGSKELASAIKVYGDTVQARKEALAMLIGNRGETLTNAAQKTKFKEWLLALWKYVQSKFPSLRDMSPSEVENLTLEQFINGALRDILGAKELETQKASEKRAKKETEPQFQIDIEAQESPLYQRRTKEDVPFVSDSEIKNLAKDGKGLERERAILDKGYKLKEGEEVTSRINLNFLRFTGIPALSIHKGKLGEVLTYAGSITLKNVTFPVQQGAREAIAKEAAEKNTQGGSKKTSMAGGKGSYVEVEPNFDGVELSFNPARGHLFVDSEGRAVMSAEEVTFLGFKAYARGKISYFEDFEDPRSPKYTAPSQTKFAKTKEELVKMADDVDTGNTTVEEVGVPELAPEAVSEAITTFSDAIENGSTIEEATEEMEIVLANSAEQGPRKVTPPTEKTEPVSANKKEEKPKAEKKEKIVGPVLSDSETIIAFTIAGNAKSIMDTTGVSQADAINEAVLEVTNGDQESADRYLGQPGVKEAVENKIKQIKAKTARELEAESPKITISERQLLLDRVKAEIKAALEGRKEGKKEGVEQAEEKAQKTIDALNKKLEEGKITKQELQDRIKELGYNIRFEAGVARLAGEKTGKSMGKKFGEFVGYFKGLKAGRTEQRGLGALVSEYIKDVIDNEFGKKGTISPATLKSIARRAATINNQKQLDAFVSYLDKVIANKRLAEGLNEIKKLQKKLLNKVGYQYTSNMKMFAKFDMFTADGDLAFDMLTMTEYLDALRDLTSERVPKIGKMMNLFDDMYDINQQNQPNDIDIADTIEKWQNSIDKLFVNPITINDFEEYKSFKREVGKYMRALNTLLETGTISEAQYESAKSQVIDASAVTDTYADQFQDQIDDLKNILIQGITDKSGYGFMDSIKDWLTNSPNTFTENQKKLIDQLMRATPKNLMTLSLEDLDLLNQVVAQIAEAGFVDEKNLRTLLDRAEIRGNEVGKSLVQQSQKVRNKYSNPKNGYIKMMRDTLGKSVVFWESRLGMKENGAFRKHLIDPIVRAINGWEKDSQRILKDYQKKVESLRSKNILKNVPGIEKLINRTKIEKFKLTTDGNLIPDGTVKVSKDAYDRVMIGVVGHILDNAWNAKQKKKSVNDWLGKQMLSAEERNKMQNEDVNELDIVNNIYNDLKKMFPDGKGGLDHMAVLEAFETDPTSILTSNQLEYYNAARSALQEAGEYINSASGIRNQQHELNPYYMPRQAIGTGKAALTSTDISYNKNVGAAIRSGASYQRVLQVPAEAIRYNVDRLVMTNVNEGLRDYYLTDAKRYVKEVFSNAQENASSDEVVMLNNLKQLSDTIAPFALEKSKSTFGLSKLMGKFFVDALIGIVRTPVEFTTNLISYAIGNRSSKSVTLPFSPKQKQETENLLSEFDSSVQFTGLEKKVKLSGKKGIDGYLDRESNFGLINKFLNNITGFMRKGEWMSQFERDFQNNTGEKFNYEKHFVKEKAKYYDDMKRAASDADFRMRRIMKGGNKAEQRQFIEWLPFVKQARISADSYAAPFVGMFSGFINHDADNLIGGLRKAVTRGEIKDGLTQSLGAYSRLALYPVLMVIGKAVANLNLGDDDEKEEAQETLDSLKTAEGWADLALFSAKQVAATLVGGKYAAGGKVVGSLLLDAAYTLFDDRRQKRLIEDTMRELYFVDPIDFYNLPSEKDDIQLQIAANLEPIIGMAVNAVADFIKDVQNKGREQVTLYDIYEWTQQTEEGKQWMYMANSLATLGQTLTVMFTPGAIPFIDDYVRWAEDELSKKEMNENTLYKTPSGKVIDIRELYLDDSQRLPVNVSGISTRERDQYSILATDKFNKAIEKEGKQIKGLFADEKYLYIDYLADKAKYDAGAELGFPYERWSEDEGEMVSTEPIPPNDRENLPESEVTLEKLHQDIIKGKQLSFVQNIKEKRKVEDYMFKEFDKNKTLENDYKNAPSGGKLGVREYFKAKYLYDKYKLTEPPVPSNYFIKEKGKIKQVESMPTEEN
jgi:hypothetical protein